MRSESTSYASLNLFYRQAYIKASAVYGKPELHSVLSQIELGNKALQLENHSINEFRLAVFESVIGHFDWISAIAKPFDLFGFSC